MPYDIPKDLRKKTFQRIVFLMLYIFIGSFMFVKIEQRSEPNIVVAKRMLQDVKKRLSLLGANVSEQEFLDLASKISEAVRIKGTPDWTYGRTCDFVIQSLTTIGFGLMTPRTETGQIVFVFFALIGLPLTMVTLQSTGELLDAGIKKLIVLFEKRLLHKQETKGICLKGAVVSCVLFVILHVYCAVLFMESKGTRFFEGIYASFVLLSTIGFGDYPFDLSSANSKFQKSDASITALIILGLPLLLFNLTLVSCFLNSMAYLLESIRERRSLLIRDVSVEGGQDADNVAASPA